MDTVYVVVRFVMNRTTNKLIVNVLQVFSEVDDAYQYVDRRTQIQEVDWCEVRECKMEMPPKSFWARMFS